MFKKKKPLLQRKYHDGDIVEFDFKTNPLDIDTQEVALVGIIYRVLYEDGDVCYKVQVRDGKRKIHGDIIVPENMINRKIEDLI